MGNKGYQAESHFETIIQNTLTTDAPTRYSEIWRRCRKAGIGSKQTLSKYLKRLEKTGFVIRDSSGYRKNPLANNPELSQLRKSVRQPGGPWQYSYFTPSDTGNVPEEQFLRMIEQEFNVTFHTYAWMLTKLVQTNNRPAAQELVGIFMRTQINPVLDDLAKKIWLERSKMPVDVLKRKKLTIIDR